MIKHNKILLPKEQKENLPIFYGFVISNDMLDATEGFSEDFLFVQQNGDNSGILYSMSEKPVSKIIDFSGINEELFKPQK